MALVRFCVVLDKAYLKGSSFSLDAYGNDRYTVDQSTKFGTVIP